MSVGVKGVYIVPDVVFDATERSGDKNITPIFRTNCAILTSYISALIHARVVGSRVDVQMVRVA